MTNKEQNFISSVVYLDNNTKNIVSFLENLKNAFLQKFENFEFIVVNNNCNGKQIDEIRKWAKEINHPLTFVHMSMTQSLEMCMNAGLDCAIGDYVYEFDAVEEYHNEVIIESFNTALLGNDIVCVSPQKSSLANKTFYYVFNKNSKSAYPIMTDLFRLVSRRAINRVHSSSTYLPFRKAAYSASGLKIARLIYEDTIIKKVSNDRFLLALDSLVLYTDAGFRISIRFTGLMMALAIAELAYTLAVFFTGHPIEGWTTMMFVLTLGLAGLFATTSIIIKYLSLILNIVFSKQKYQIEGIEKIQK